ncbi:tectonin beta-propeller repeat-containing protein 2-like [Asterias amurensis]|uniref:tectonin beta-propeller repeat-containing protein 2-like n=1 Tax=Asterias amurensis TaxID=7602 RepID=UPI003AB583D0
MADLETTQNPTPEGQIPTDNHDDQTEKPPTEPSITSTSRISDLSMDSLPNVLPELCEFAPLDFILKQLPQKAQRAQRALTAITVEFTCMDANKDFIVLGANFSMVFVYDRCENSIIKLRCDDRNCRITCVKIMTSLDHQIAVGTSSGQVEIYLLPAKRPGQTTRELKKFFVDGGHRSNVTCAEWSANGMKLFTGDSIGNVVYTAVDFYENKCHSELILKEEMPIVQLNYAHKILIISTYSRTVLCHTDEKYRLQQVGQRPRKSKGYFGGHFVPGLCAARDAILCATRPGLRLWRANTDGTVLETLKFKDLLVGVHQTIMLLPSTRQQVQTATDQQFGPVLFFNESYILTWSHNLLVVLDMVGPSGARVVASSLGDLGSIISVATCGSEIYVLRRGLDRPLIRIATEPEVFPLKEHISLAETDHLKVSRPGTNSGTNSNTSSPSLPRKDRGSNSIKQGLFAVKTLFSKAKEEIVDTTSKLKVPKFGKLDQEDGNSAGSSRRGSQDGPTAMCQTPDATISPEIIAAQFAARGNETVHQVSPGALERDHNVVEHSEAQPSGGPGALALDQTGLALTGESQAEEEQLPNEHPMITLNEKKLMEIGQRSFDDELVRPVKHSKKKKKKSTHKGKKDPSDRSATPSPTPEDSNGSSNFPKTQTLNPRSEVDKSRSDSFNSDSCSVRSDRSSSDSKEPHPEILSVPGLDAVQLDSTGSDSLKMESGNMQTDCKNMESNSRTPEVQELKNDTSAPSKETSLHSENMRTRNEHTKKDIQEGQSALPEGVVAFSRGGLERMITGMVADSNENIETRLGSPILNTMSPPSVIGVNDLARTLKSWEGADAMSQAQGTQMGHPAQSQQTGRTYTISTDSIHSLVSDDANLKLDLHKEVPSDAPGPREQEHSNAEILPPAEMNNDKETTVNKESALSKADSTDDEFYGKYLSQSPSSDSSPPGIFAIEEANPPGDVEEGMLEDTPIPENIQQRFAGSWMQCNTPGFIFQLMVSDKHIWCVDNKDRVYHSLVSNVSLKWNKLKESAMQIATSPSGNIVWRLHRRTNTAFACAPISPQCPIGTKWYEAARGIIHICLDETMAWLVLNSGAIYVCKGISRDVPYTRPQKAASDAFVTQIAANRGVVWAIGSNKMVMYRSGITRKRPEGTKWMVFEDLSFKLKFASIALDSRNVGWGIDDEGLVWFRTGVTPNSPEGDDKKWWQVPMGEYLMQDPNALKMLLNMAGTNATVDRMTNWLKRQYYRATHIAASAGSLWVCGSYHYKSSLHVSKGNLLGSRWESGCPAGLPLSAVWVTLSATGVYGPSGTIWAALKSGEVFCFPPDTRKPLQVDPPRAGAVFKHLSATADTLWALTEESYIYVRQRITERSPQGLSWKKLNLDQLGPCKLVHFSCGADVVWACDNEGIIYLRIGVDIPNDVSLPAAWVPVDGKAVGYGAHFVQVFCSVDNRLVWAIDSKKTVYVRKGICDGLPLGLEWEVVEGTQAVHLCISSSTVWALCPNGDVACRFGITERNCVGDYWKKVPGSYTYLSVTQSDDLWALSSEGKLFQRFTKMFHRRGLPQIEQQESPLAEDDWELL